MSTSRSKCGRDFAERISDARLAELPGDEHVCCFDGDLGLEQIGKLLSASHPDHATSARALATVMFTDIVGSTVTVATLGDECWGVLLGQHDRIVAEEVAFHGGRVVQAPWRRHARDLRSTIVGHLMRLRSRHPPARDRR